MHFSLYCQLCLLLVLQIPCSHDLNFACQCLSSFQNVLEKHPISNLHHVVYWCLFFIFIIIYLCMVGIDSHNWLPRSQCFRPGTDRSLKVNSLFDVTTRQWDRGRIQSLFYNSTWDDILGIKLGNTMLRRSLKLNVKVKKGKAELKKASKSGLKTSIAQIKHQKRLKVWLKWLLEALSS